MCVHAKLKIMIMINNLAPIRKITPMNSVARILRKANMCTKRANAMGHHHIVCSTPRRTDLATIILSYALARVLYRDVQCDQSSAGTGLKTCYCSENAVATMNDYRINRWKITASSNRILLEFNKNSTRFSTVKFLR